MSSSSWRWRKFCRLFFHMDECLEWKNSEFCLDCKNPCVRNAVCCVAQIQKQDRTVIRWYRNRSLSDLRTVHAEEWFFSDPEWKNLDKEEITLYLTFQPCHQNTDRSCVELILAWKKLHPNVKLTIKCTGLYRAHWTEKTLYESDNDYKHYSPKAESARQGIRALLVTPNITLQSMTKLDWTNLISWHGLQPNELAADVWALRSQYDQQIQSFLEQHK